MNDRIQPLEIQRYIKLSQTKGIISLAAGLPDISVLPLDKLKEAYTFIVEEKNVSFQYRPPIDSLKVKIQEIMRTQSVECSLDEILIISGAQQGIYLTANLFLKNKALLMTEELVYPGFLQIVNMFDLAYLLLPSTFNEGLDLDYLEVLLKTQHPLPYLYVICSGHNPQGITLGIDKRKHLAYLAEKYNFIVIEDDPYGLLNFSDEKFLPIRAYTKNSVYIGSFSKIIAPIIRIGWMVGEKHIIEKLHHLKDMNDLYLLNPNHLALNRLLEDIPLAEILKPQKELYKKKKDYMIEALNKYMKVPFRYTTPQHGIFIWLDFPTINIEQHKDTLFKESNVLFIPASAFSMGNLSEKSGIRLNYSYPSFEDILAGIKNLSNVLSKLARNVATIKE